MAAAVPFLTRLQHLPWRVRSLHALSDDALFELCAMNRDLRIERTKDGELVIMPPTGGKTGARNSQINRQLGNWAASYGGVVFDSSTGFILPNTAERAPDAAWLRRDRWDALSDAQKEKFIPLAPDFVIELRSPSDELDEVKAKMEEYRENGVALGWLLDPFDRRAYVYRAGAAVEIIDEPSSLDATPALGGFVLQLEPIWRA